MKLTRRDFFQTCGYGPPCCRGAAAYSPPLWRRTSRFDRNHRAPIGRAGTAGECGIRRCKWATERMNKDGGIAGASSSW